jgi:hypothetical protein
MVKKFVNQKNALLALELAVVGFLCWMVTASNLLTQPGSTVQAQDQQVQKDKKQTKKDRRWLPTEGVPEERSLNIVSQLGTPNACSGFEFAGGSLEGFTVVPIFGTPLNLWHVTNGLCRAFLNGHSTPYTFYYGQDATCNYSTGARNAANLISPPISLVGKFPPYSLGFNYLLFVEGGGFDSTFVDISTDNGATWTQVLSKANMINDNQWHNVATNITAVVGAATSVRVRYRFDSVDNIANSTTGWHVDDIVVCGQPFNFCIQDDTTGDYIQFNSITGAYIAKQCSTGFTVEGTGVVTASGSTVTLTQNLNNQFITATVNTSTNTGSASIAARSGLSIRSFKLKDTSTLNNSCSCPN